ncbi:MAG: pyruvate kinase [Candidatus Dojkabacteria bacterium]|nr:MAG: pyruvate kinase [Candidatus Dojkabacteria bacterium]
MHELPKTKIIATIGPSTWDDDTLTEMINYGFTVARVNASFADFDEQERVITQLRRLSPKVAVMLDTMGHKVRVTGFDKDRVIAPGDEIILLSEKNKSKKRNSIKVTYPTLEKDVTRNTKILIDDGNIELKVKDIVGKEVVCEVIHGGVLKKRKTVNVPGVHLNFPALSEKDETDIKNAVKLGYDFISASFVRNLEDVKLVREAMGKSDLKLIAKIEDYEGVRNFDKILEKVDGIMVARGDLGVELPLEEVPILQKQFIQKCRMKGKIVIVATQMLESMRESTRPTRAETSDVANAVMDGADAVMLSAETSTGKNPVETVKHMARIAKRAEEVLRPQIVEGRTDAYEISDIICKHLFGITEEVALKGVIIFSDSGNTVKSLARHRLNIPIWCVSNNHKIIRQQQMIRGVTGIYVENMESDRDEIAKHAVSAIYGRGYLEMGDKVAIISGGTVHNRRYNTILEILEVQAVLE